MPFRSTGRKDEKDETNHSMKGKRYGLLLLLMLAGADICTGQPHRRDVYFGPLADYILINDQSIGDTPVSGLEAGLTVGFRNRGPKSMWGVSLWGAYGFMNIFPSGELNDDSDIIVPIGTFSPSLLSAHLPNYNSRIANRYSGALEGEYLRLVTRPGTRWSVFLGGLFSLQAHYN